MPAREGLRSHQGAICKSPCRGWWPEGSFPEGSSAQAGSVAPGGEGVGGGGAPPSPPPPACLRFGSVIWMAADLGPLVLECWRLPILAAPPPPAHVGG